VVVRTMKNDGRERRKRIGLMNLLPSALLSVDPAILPFESFKWGRKCSISIYVTLSHLQVQLVASET
jgi:hypothetical protein